MANFAPARAAPIRTCDEGARPSPDASCASVPLISFGPVRPRPERGSPFRAAQKTI